MFKSMVIAAAMIAGVFTASADPTTITFVPGSVNKGDVLAINYCKVVPGGATIDWGDGTVDSNVVKLPAMHRAKSDGISEVKVDGLVSVANNWIDPLKNGTKDKVLSISFGTEVTDVNGGDEFRSLESVTFPQSVRVIGKTSFVGTKLESISIPASVVSVSPTAFYKSNGIKSVKVDPSNTVYETSNGCGIYEKKSKTLISGINVTEIAAGTKAIGQECFCGSTITNITIPYSIVSVGASCFCYCGNITEITIPESVSRLMTRMFYGCDNLSKVTVRAFVGYIGTACFDGCKNIKEVEFTNMPTAAIVGRMGYPWGLPSGCVIHCTDSDVTVR